MKNKSKLLCALFGLTVSISACNSNRNLTQSSTIEPIEKIQEFKSQGGSSGMEQLSGRSYMAVYDLKSHNKGIRMGLIQISNESLSVSPIEIDAWGAEGTPNDLESICSIPERPNEFLLAEAGNWQGKLGRIFHVQVDVENMRATVLGSVKLPFLHLNDFDITGDQYEALICLPYDKSSRVVLLGERGGAKCNPTGLIRWGVLNLVDYTFEMSDEGLEGIGVSVPGNWTDFPTKRDITDFHIDSDGDIWASASEDQGETGPFYSVIYKLGKTNLTNKEKPFIVFETINIIKEVSGFKIEAISGPCQGLNSSHVFGTEDEIYGGVWRPINIE